MFVMRRPAPAEIARWLAAQESVPFPDSPPPGLTVDHHRTVLGLGAESFRRACVALARWEMFRLGWVEIVPAGAPIRVGTTVGVLVHHLGLWSLNPCRIVALVEEGGAVERSGFVYRTLPEHAVEGEERFQIAWDHADDTVAYDVTAWSRPRHVLARVGYPIGRLIQRRFATDSQRAMRVAVT